MSKQARQPRPGFLETLREGRKASVTRSTGSGRRRTAGGKAGKAGKGAASANGASPIGTAVGEPELLKRREQLSKQFTELQWDLGGMAYEMASRDHFRLDVLAKQAAKVQQVDSELGQIERMLKMEEAGAAGACPRCSALQARGAVFCWQCGKELAPPAKPGKGKAKKKT